MGFWDEAEEAHYEEHGAETAETVEVERSTADSPGHKEPGAEDTDHVDSVLAEGEIEGFGGFEAGLLEEVGGIAGEGVS